MCGRTACTLGPEKLCRACRYQNKASGKTIEPRWIDEQSKADYYPSFNVCPQNKTPVLLSGNQVDGVEEGERVLQTMKWGLLPSWHKGHQRSFHFNTINARLDTVMEKATYRNPLKKGRRCVVLADGFYEWQKMDKGKKQPYFLYFKDEQEKGGDIVEEMDAEEKRITSRILTMAGVYDRWTPPKAMESQEPIYSYSIITVEASKSIGWLHDRMPAILDGEDAIEKWLNTGEYDAEAALALLKPTDCLSWHPVAPAVGNVKNKSEECVKRIDLSTPTKPDTKGGLLNWLKPSPKKRHSVEEETNEEPPCKKTIDF
ncbi:abasic site processing protein HMCES-like [Oscarella lobularis]|uniref:abasic site processing protein HMCES-like n=1 Tax=Oscarella lobularis TaxID=121494 RepID=UPI00331340E2